MLKRTDHYYIYVKDKNGIKTGHCICVVLREGKIFHGTALCSKHDNFDKKVGRKLAYERALEAYSKHEDAKI